MSRKRTRGKWRLILLGLSLGAALLAWVAGFALLGSVGWIWGTLLFFSGALAAAAGWIGFTTLSGGLGEHVRLASVRRALKNEVSNLERQRKTFETRLMTYQEWMEFPSAQAAQIPEAAVQDVTARDRAIQEIVDEASVRVLEGIQNDRFSTDGRFEPQLLASELFGVMTAVAQIYRPDSSQPLLETSVEKFLKSINQVSLQLLSQLESLPFNLKDYSLVKAYEHAKHAQRVHGYYRAVTPYLPYASYTWQIGRLVLGANPLIAGAWMLGSEVVKRTGKRMGKRYVEKYFVYWIANAIRLIANHGAMAYDPHYRYRDPNWVYGMELAELVHIFPASRDTLRFALSEIGNLSFRNSYDRIFLYRCIVDGKSPNPDGMPGRQGLGNEQKRVIAERLEQFFRRHIHGRHRERVQKWVSEASRRLGIAITVDEDSGRLTSERANESALVSLASFLIGLKEWAPEQLQPVLMECEATGSLSPEQLTTVLKEIRNQPPMFFDFPNLEPGSEVAGAFMNDLVRLELSDAPADHLGYLGVREAAYFFREDWSKIEQRLLSGYRKLLSAKFEDDAPKRTFSDELLLAFPHLTDGEELPLFVYNKVSLDEEISYPVPERWLVGTPRRLALFEVFEDRQVDDFDYCRIGWEYTGLTETEGPPLQVSRRKRLSSALTLTGGTWIDLREGTPEPAIIVPSDVLRSSGSYFAPLRRWLERRGDC